MSILPELPDPLRRASYRWFMPITTRWMDNDLYGHINNAHYYSYFDTVANAYLIRECDLDIHQGEVIGYIVHSQCFYRSSLAFPDQLEGGLRVNRIGNTSVEYGIAIFRESERDVSAYGTFTHVFVDRENERPTPIAGHLRDGLARILASQAQA